MVEISKDCPPWETMTVIEGGAKGADELAGICADVMDWEHKTFAPDPADGYPQKFFIRNQRMADHDPRPEVCIAMIDVCTKDKCEDNDEPAHMTHGTADMIRRAQKNGITIAPYGRTDLYVN